MPSNILPPGQPSKYPIHSAFLDKVTAQFRAAYPHAILPPINVSLENNRGPYRQMRYKGPKHPVIHFEWVCWLKFPPDASNNRYGLNNKIEVGLHIEKETQAISDSIKVQLEKHFIADVANGVQMAKDFKVAKMDFRPYNPNKANSCTIALLQTFVSANDPITIKWAVDTMYEFQEYWREYL
jgi:hypothetical protein